MDLFNHGYFWEAHAQWERLWKGSREEPLARDFFAGLVQVAAALLKRRAGQPAGAVRLLGRALPKLRAVSGRDPRFGGVDLEAFTSELESFVSLGRPFLAGRGDPTPATGWAQGCPQRRWAEGSDVEPRLRLFV